MSGRGNANGGGKWNKLSGITFFNSSKSKVQPEPPLQEKNIDLDKYLGDKVFDGFRYDLFKETNTISMKEIKEIITDRSFPGDIEEDLLDTGLTVTETVVIEIPTEVGEEERGEGSTFIEVKLNDDDKTIDEKVNEHVEGIVNIRKINKSINAQIQAATKIQARVRGNKVRRIAANAQRAKVETQNKDIIGQPFTTQLTRAHSAPKLTRRALSTTAAGQAITALDKAAAAKAAAAKAADAAKAAAAKAASQGGTKRHTRKKK